MFFKGWMTEMKDIKITGLSRESYNLKIRPEIQKLKIKLNENFKKK